MKLPELVRPIAVATSFALVAASVVLAGEEQPAGGQAPPLAEQAPSAASTEPGATAAEPVEPGAADDTERKPEFNRPKYNVLRFNEDWSGLEDFEPGTTGDPYDFMKYVRITDDGEVYLSLGGQARSRVESWQNFGWGGPGERDDTFWLNRGMAHMDLHVTKYLRGFIEGKAAFSSTRDLPGGIRSVDRDELDIQNGFVDLRLPVDDVGTFIFRPGRQELLFGRQRLVGPLDWVNARRTFDGFSGIAELKSWKVHAFYTQYVIVDQFDFNQPDPQTELWGAYATGKVPSTSIGLDAYFLALNRDTAANPAGFNGTTGREDRYTFGGRIFGGIGDTPLDYDVEGAYQTGSVGSGDIDAFMFASELGYKLPDVWGTPRPFIGFDYASGDGKPGGNVGTFNQLFPTQHLYQGLLDTLARQNVIDFNAGVSLNLTEKVSTRTAAHYFLRASSDDALYGVTGAAARPGTGSGSQDVGAEIDALLKYVVNAHLFAVVGYAHFFPGDFIEDTGSSKEIDWGFLQLQYTF